MRNIFLSLFLVLNYGQFFAQNAADVETSFGSLPGFNGIINAMVEQPDGKIIIGGNFTKYKSNDCKYLTRLLPNGDIDSSFNTGDNIWYGVTSIELQLDGKILVGGGFKSLIFGFKVGITRLNSDGSTDSTFDAINAFNGVIRINTIKALADGKILILGSFTNYFSDPRRYVARINSNGSLDSTFNPGEGFNYQPSSLVIQSDGKIVLAGRFNTYNGYTRNGIIRLNTDATVDLTFSIGVGFNSDGYDKRILLQSDGKIIVAGGFISYKNATQNGLIRLMQNGDKDTGFNIGTGFSSYNISDIKMDNLGNFIIGGLFNSFNGIQKKNCLKLDINGALDNSFTIDNSPQIYSILIQNDLKVILGGNPFISRFNNNGTFDNSFDFGKGFDKYINSLLVQSDGKIIVGGNFGLKDLVKQKGLMRLNPDGTKDSSFNLDYIPGDGSTEKLLLQPDGKIIAFGYYGIGAFVNRFNSDGSLDNSFANNISLSGIFFDAVLQPDGKIVMVGQFFVSPNTYAGVVRINSDGTYDNTYDYKGFNGYVYDMAVQPDGKIIFVGAFTVYDGQQYNRIIRLLPNGEIDNTFSIGEGINYTSDCITLQTDGKILIGGCFTSYNLIPSSGIVRINPDGSYDSTFNGGNNVNCVRNIKVQSDGKIIIGGSYNLGAEIKKFVRLNSNGSIDNSFDIGTGFSNYNYNYNNYIYNIELQNDGKILVAGDFDSYNSISSSMLVRLFGGNSILSNENENLLNTKLLVYPNPTNGFIKIQLPSFNSDFYYEIFDFMGKLIKKQYLNDRNNFELDLSDKESGIYLIKIYIDDKVFTEKLIKQ